MSDLEQQTENEEPKTEERLTSIKNENFLPTVTEENENIDSSEAEKAETATLEMKAEEDGSSAPMMKSQEKKASKISQEKMRCISSIACFVMVSALFPY